MAYCPNCGSFNSPQARFCTSCATPLSTPIGQTSEAFEIPTAAAFSQERPITDTEISTLAKYGTNQKQWAVSMGFVNMLLGAFAFVEPAQDFGSDGVTALGAMTLVLGIMAVALGAASRAARKLASNVVRAGAVRESQGVVQGSSTKATRIGLQDGGVLEVPRQGIAGKLGPDGSSAVLVFSKPPQQGGRSKVILLSANGYPLAKPLQCVLTGGGPQ
jgi:hypothetical protein